MRRPDAAELKLCALQANVFEASTDALSCGSAVFIRRFMNSQMAMRMDDAGFDGAPSRAQEAFDLIEAEYGPSSYGSEHYTPDELHWIGYLYRYWCCSMDMRSKVVFKIAGARKMRGLYPAYHTLDPAQAVERILEAAGIDANEDPIERGVRVLRRIREASNK